MVDHINPAARAIMSDAERRVADDIAISMRVQNIQQDAHELYAVRHLLTDQDIDSLMRSVLLLANMGMELTAPAPVVHDHGVHHDADGADGRDGHAS